MLIDRRPADNLTTSQWTGLRRQPAALVRRTRKRTSTGSPLRRRGRADVLAGRQATVPASPATADRSYRRRLFRGRVLVGRRGRRGRRHDPSRAACSAGSPSVGQRCDGPAAAGGRGEHSWPSPTTSWPRRRLPTETRTTISPNQELLRSRCRQRRQWIGGWLPGTAAAAERRSAPPPGGTTQVCSIVAAGVVVAVAVVADRPSPRSRTAGTRGDRHVRCPPAHRHSGVSPPGGIPP